MNGSTWLQLCDLEEIWLAWRSLVREWHVNWPFQPIFLTSRSRPIPEYSIGYVIVSPVLYPSPLHSFASHLTLPYAATFLRSPAYFSALRRTRCTVQNSCRSQYTFSRSAMALLVAHILSSDLNSALVVILKELCIVFVIMITISSIVHVVLHYQVVLQMYWVGSMSRSSSCTWCEGRRRS